MRIALMGQAAFGEAVLKRFVEEGIDVIGVSAPPPGAGRPDPLWAAAVELGMAPVPTADLKNEQHLSAWKALGADLCVMAFVTDILPDEVFSIPRLGTIQYHPSLLPLHRGASAINWAIINGDTETGLTIFWPEEGIDTGPILLQKSCAIGPDDTVGSLYFGSLFQLGVDAMVESVRLVEGGNPPREIQDHHLSTYEPPCRDEHATIRWYEPAERIYALIRGCNPQPGAWTTHDGKKLRIFDCRLTGNQEPGRPGKVLRVTPDGIDIRLNGGVLRVARVQAEGGKKVPAAEWAESVSLEEGFRFR